MTGLGPGSGLAAAVRTRVALALLVLLGVLTLSPQLAEAHNWLGVPCRGAGIALTVQPGPPRRSERPHLMVGRDQPFTIDWASGHNGTSYMILLREEDAWKLKQWNEESFKKYLANGPGNCGTTPPAGPLHKQVRLVAD